MRVHSGSAIPSRWRAHQATAATTVRAPRSRLPVTGEPVEGVGVTVKIPLGKRMDRLTTVRS
jgi:hypothetical protein